MKKMILLMLGVAVAVSACEPITGNKKMGGILKPEELNIEIQGTTPGSNEVQMVNNTYGVGSFWDWGLGVSTKQKETVVLPFTGDIPINFTGICDGGLVTVTKTVSVTRLDKPVDPTWAMLAGSGPAGKTWVWDDRRATSVFGTGGFGNDWAPAWGASGIGDKVNGLTISPDDKMVFDLNGGANFTVTSVNGNAKGSFKFDVSNGKKRYATQYGGGRMWCIGEMTFSGASVLCGVEYYGGTTPIYNFYIVELTEDTLVLAYAAPGSGWEAWATCNFWMFKAQ